MPLVGRASRHHAAAALLLWANPSPWWYMRSREIAALSKLWSAACRNNSAAALLLRANPLAVAVHGPEVNLRVSLLVVGRQPVPP